MKIEEYNIGGLNVILAHMDTTSTTIEIMFKIGSVYENKNNNGISHFMEHMFFKGGKKYKNFLEVSQALEKVGGIFNAGTSFEYTTYYVKVAPNFIDTAIDVLQDMLVNCKLAETDLEKEKKIIIQELKTIQDNPLKDSFYKFNLFYYKNTPFGWPIIGKEKNILNFTRKDLIEFKNKAYTKDNMLIVIAGKILNKDKILKQIEKGFDNLSPKKQIITPKFTGITDKKEASYDKKDINQSYLYIGIPGFKNNDERRYPADILSTILGGLTSSILFQKVREKLGLCYFISADHYSRSYDGFFLIRAIMDKNKFKMGRKQIDIILDDFSKGNIKEDEFKKAISNTIGQLQMGIETSDQLASFIIYNKLFKNKIELIDEIINKIKSIKYEDVLEIAKNRFKKENRYYFYNN